MQLKIGPEIDDNRVKLDYKPGVNNPAKTPSYIVDKDISDEFVSKYNKQSDNLRKLTTLSVSAGAITGWVISLKNAACNGKKLWGTAMLDIPIGVAVGFLSSVLVSNIKKNNLMDKYNVKVYEKE